MSYFLIPNERSSPNLAGSSSNLGDNRVPEGCLLSDQLDLPVVDDLQLLSLPFRSRMELLAAEPKSKGKVDRQVLIDVPSQKLQPMSDRLTPAFPINAPDLIMPCALPATNCLGFYPRRSTTSVGSGDVGIGQRTHPRRMSRA